jgi:ferredoxin-type protein NapH
MKIRLRPFLPMVVSLAIFAAIALGLWSITGSVFYLVNFLLIGACLALGTGLWPLLSPRRKPMARRLSQLLVGGYLFIGIGVGLVYLGFGYIMPENLQIEGFWLWLFSGVFMASVLHYLIAKIAGPLLFSRGWCGWACWTAAVLDLLPWKRSPGRLAPRWERMRWLSLAVSSLGMVGLMLVTGLSVWRTIGVVRVSGEVPVGVTRYAGIAQIPELWWFLAGNAAYYVVGITLAAVLRDNRAFCKYLCPVCLLMKAGSRFSLLKIGTNAAACTFCGACERACPMDVRITEYLREHRRVSCSECIICQSCIAACPRGALQFSLGFDVGFRDRLVRRAPALFGEDTKSDAIGDRL